MANPTSNFGWQMPTNTDLVKDLPADFEVFGQAVDTSLADLKGGTTGQVLSKASNTDMDFTWVAQDDSNAIQNAIVDAKGDLISATAADTPARLASSGVNGDVLTVDTTTATGLKWAAPASGVTNWTRRLTISGAQVLTIAHNGSMYIAAGEGFLYSSTDGITWTSRTSGMGGNNTNKVIWVSALSLWVAVGNNGLLSTSSDGITWTSQTANMSTNNINDVFANGTTIVAVGNGGGTTNTGGITYSTDGTTWTRKSQSITVGTTYNAVTYNGTNWLVVGSVSTNNALYASTPSGTWTAFNLGSTSVTFAHCFYDGTGTIVISNAGRAYYSTSTTYATAPSQFPRLIQQDGSIFGTAYQRAYYYNGRIYWVGAMAPGATIIAYIMGEATTANTSQYFNYFAPYDFVVGTGSDVTPNSVWVGSTGKILGVGNQIYTSF